MHIEEPGPELLKGPIHGFSRKLHCYQIASYIVFAILVFSYWFLTFCLSRTVLKIVGGTLEGIFMLVIIASGYIATATDPSDSILVESIKARNANVPYNPPSKEFFCNVDMTYVNESSKHCKRCNRCTEDFDHHCKWINNDIGKKNYKSFVVLIMAVLVYLLIYLAMAVVVTVDWANDNSLADNHVFLYDTSSQIKGAMICLWVILGLSLIFLVMDLNLVLFHIYLIHKGLTTFQYIVLTEERKEYKKEMERARRIIGNKKQNRTCLDFVLCLKKKKKKPRNVPSIGSNYVPSTNQAANGITEIDAERQPANIEMAEYQSNHREHQDYRDEPTPEGIERENKDEKNVYRITVNEAENKEPQEIVVGQRNRPADNILEIEQSVDEFGDVTAMNYSKNKSALSKSLHFESVKAMEERKTHHEQQENPNISLHVLDDNNINIGREREPKSNYIVRDPSPLVSQENEKKPPLGNTNQVRTRPGNNGMEVNKL